MASSADERRKLFDEVTPAAEVRAVAVPVTLETLNLPFYSARIITVVAHARNEIMYRRELNSILLRRRGADLFHTFVCRLSPRAGVDEARTRT